MLGELACSKIVLLRGIFGHARLSGLTAPSSNRFSSCRTIFPSLVFSTHFGQLESSMQSTLGFAAPQYGETLRCSCILHLNFQIFHSNQSNNCVKSSFKLKQGTLCNQKRNNFSEVRITGLKLINEKETSLFIKSKSFSVMFNVLYKISIYIENAIQTVHQLRNCSVFAFPRV